MKALVFVIAGILLSGCIAAESSTPNAQPNAAGQPAPEAAQPATFDETSGAISGLVVNEEGLPVGGALVGLRETSAQTIADVGGTFTFSNVAPGEYTVDVSQLGYESSSKRVTVVAGEVAHVNFGLIAISVEGPYYESIIENGNVQCSVRAYPGVPTTGAAGAPPWTTGVAVCGVVGIPGFEADRFLVDWEFPAGVLELLAEMEWSTTQATGAALGFAVELDGRANDPDASLGSPRGRSPLILYANQTHLAEKYASSGVDGMADDFTAITRVFAEADTTGMKTPVPLGPFPDPLGDPADRADFGFTFDQRYTIYITHFHGGPAPEGYTSLSDG